MELGGGKVIMKRVVGGWGCTSRGGMDMVCMCANFVACSCCDGQMCVFCVWLRWWWVWFLLT